MKTIIMIILALIGILVGGCAPLDTQSFVKASSSVEPDLIIAGIWSNPSAWVIGEKMNEVVFLVKNVGKTRTGWVTVCNHAGGVEGPYLHKLIEGTVCRSFDLKPGETIKYHHKCRDVNLPWWNKKNYWVKITGNIDFDNRLREGNENNNQYTKQFNYVSMGIFPIVQEVR